jgi:DNA polymerase III epsilon subunit-like protein
MYLFFDTETNGFPPNARMTQLGFILTDADGNVIKEYQSVIKPDGWIIKDKQWYLDNGASEEEAEKKGGFFTDNNISTARCEKEGVPVFGPLREFQEALKQCKYKIAHNIRFDNQIVQNELIFAGITHQLFQFKKSHCTMLTNVKFVGALNKWGKPDKWPKLEELHIKLFGENFDGAHDALSDVRAMVKCFFELKKRGLVTI